ncbi:haloacid dehalogenase type II [Ramlibacter sp. AN1133]|uniref:haloacid dehalogenase type II n=1 Tax=Ramlibacter sp. AN1133 TaxID=3133429 RepID=UPI0030C61AAD
MNKVEALVFDLYGTLCDVHSVAAACDTRFPGRGREISVMWRQKQLEYTWMRSLMGCYENFEKATYDALAFACRQLGLELAGPLQQELCDAYLHLAAFPEVPSALKELQARDLKLAVLSNGSARSIDAVVTHAGIAPYFDELISVDEVGIFKPHHRVYELAERRLGVARSAILFVSSNSWDATGAAYYGYSTCWVNRARGCFDELGRSPDLEVPHLGRIAPALHAAVHPA